MAAKRLFLHIGARKTGSSMLQTMFARNVGCFLKQGLYYPETRSLRWAARGYTTAGNGESLIGVLRPERMAKSPGESPDGAFLRLMEHSPCSRVLISSELFCGAGDRAVARFKVLLATGAIDAEMLYFVRNPLDHAFSTWTQAIKSGRVSNTTWREFLRSYVMPFEAVIRRFRDHFGDGVHVLNYDYYQDALFESVCKFVDVTPENPGSDVRVNRSPTKFEAELLLHTNKFLLESNLAPEDRANLTKRIYQQLVMRPSDERMCPLLAGDDLEIFERNNAEGVAYVNRFISGAPLTLHRGNYATGELVLDPPAGDVRAMLDAVLGAAVYALKRRKRGVRRRGGQTENGGGKRPAHLRPLVESQRRRT